MKTHRIFDKFDVCRFLPILQILEIVNKIGLLEVATLCQEVEIIGVAQTLHEFHFSLESKPLFFLLVTDKISVWRLMLKL